LEKGAYVAVAVSDGREAIKTFYSWQPHLVILDIMMPKMDGWTVLERIREVSAVPVIMLTALGQEHQKVRGLQEGADDYLVKPIGIPELLARVEAILRRVREPPEIAAVYADRAVYVDFKTHRTLVDDHELKLSPMEFRLLAGCGNKLL
jgi:two-component system response regulator ResD